MTKEEQLALAIKNEKEKQIIERQRMVEEELPNVFMNYIIGHGYWMQDKIDGTYRNYLMVSNSLGFTPEEVLLAHDIAVARSQGYYLNSASAKTLSGKLGASGLLPMLAGGYLAGPAGPAVTYISAARTGAAISMVDALFSASIKPTPLNIAFHGMAGASLSILGLGAFKLGAFAYKEAAIPAAHAVIDYSRFVGFSKVLKQELIAISKEIAYNQLSPLSHGINYAKGHVHSAITGALGEAKMGYVLQRVLARHYGFSRMISKYDKVHGFDGLYVVTDAFDNIVHVLFAESKASSRAYVHGLSTGKDGVQQLSRAHINKTLDKMRQVKPLKELADNVGTFLETEANWKHVTRFLAKTNGSGWTQWFEAVGGLVDNSKVTLRPLSDSFKLIQKNSNTLTLKRRAAAGLLPGVAASNAYSNPEYADESIDIVAPTHAQMREQLNDGFPHDVGLEARAAKIAGESYLNKPQPPQTPQFSKNFAQPSWALPPQKQAERPKAKGEHPPVLKGLWEGQGVPTPPVEPPAPKPAPEMRVVWEGIIDPDQRRGSRQERHVQYNYGNGWENARRPDNDNQAWDNQANGGGPGSQAEGHAGNGHGGDRNDNGPSDNGGGYQGCGSLDWDGRGGSNDAHSGGDLSCSYGGGDNGGMSCRRG